MGNLGMGMDKVGMVMAMLVIMVASTAIVGRCDPSESNRDKARRAPWRIHTLFSVECQDYFDWQTVRLMDSFRKSGQSGPITRLLSCTDEEMKGYGGMELAPTFRVPSMSRHPKTGDW